MLIFVRNITYDFYGKNDHLFTVKNNDTVSSLKDKILTHFKISKGVDIDMFNDKTEQLLDENDQLLSDCFGNGHFQSITFSEK